jgi:hypothetical protein
MVAVWNVTIRILVKHCVVMTWEYNYTSNYYKETVSITTAYPDTSSVTIGVLI